MVNAELAPGGELSCGGQIVGRLQGFRFTPEAGAGVEPIRADDADVAGAIARELDARAHRFSEAVDGALVLANDGAIRWLGDPIAKIAGGETLLAPRALLLADENLSDEARQKAQARIDLWLAATVRRLLGPLFDLEAAVGLEGAARNVALQLVQALGVLERGRVAHDVKSLDQNARGMLRKMGVRFGAYYIYLPNLVKPAIRVLATLLWALRQGAPALAAGLDEIPQLAASGRTSFLSDAAIARETYRVAGFRLCGERAVRVDIVERLADLIRPAVAYRPGVSPGAPPLGSADGDGFVVTGAMTSLAGCSGEPFASVLRSLGFVSQHVKGPAMTLAPSAPEIAPPANDPSDSTAAPTADAGTGEVGESETASATGGEAAEGAADPVAARDIRTGEGGESETSQATGGDAAEPAADPVAADAGADEVGESETAPATVGDAAEPTTDQVAAAGTGAVGESVTAQATGGDAAEAAADLADANAADGIVASSEASTVDAATAPAAPGDVLVEVWRPRPIVRQRMPRRGSKDRAPAHAEPAAEGEAQPGRRGDRTGRRGDRRRPPAAGPPPAGVEAATEAEAASRPREEPRGSREGRGFRRRADPAGNGEGPADRRSGRNNSGAPDQRRPEPAPPARREPPVNLNSPFAKLLALKSQLEAKGKGG